MVLAFHALECGSVSIFKTLLESKDKTLVCAGPFK